MLWVVQQINGQPLIAGSTVTVEFASGGRISGSAGCNGYGGLYEMQADPIDSSAGGDGHGNPFEAQAGRITIGQVAITEMYCMDPAGVMDQEQAFLKALSAVARYQEAHYRFDLLDDAGQVVLSLFPAALVPTVDLEGTDWVLVTFLDGATAASVLNGTEVTLRLEQGSVTGTAGCNSYGGTYTWQGDPNLGIGPLNSTKMFCESPAGVMEQEGKYLDLLQRVTWFKLAAGQLTLLVADGPGLVFRTR
jgi:heat shock protein HslJ